MLKWFKENVLGSLVAALLGGIIVSLFLLSGNFVSTKAQNLSQTWVPEYSVLFSWSKQCPTEWLRVGYTVVEVDKNVDTFLETLDHPSGSGSLYEELNVKDQKGRTLVGWNLVKFYTCVKIKPT